MVAGICGEDQVVRLLPFILPGERDDEEFRDLHRSALVALRGPDFDLTTDFDSVDNHLQSSALEIDLADPQSDCLTPPESGVGKEIDQGRMIA
jgi:hypothetical protein